MASPRNSGAFLFQVRAPWRMRTFIRALELNG